MSLEKGKLNGLDLFSGIGGLSEALDSWVETIAYCERDSYAQSVLLSRMEKGELDAAPIWEDVSTLRGRDLPSIDIIFGGFPCQDISVAGRGVGLEGKRSGLFFEILRLIDECKPAFVFLENVPAIRTRGLHTIIEELSNRGFQCRWTNLSAQEVGANHKRDRWFLLAYSEKFGRTQGDQVLRWGSAGTGEGTRDRSAECSSTLPDPDSDELRLEQGRSSGKDGQGEAVTRNNGSEESVEITSSQGRRCQGSLGPSEEGSAGALSQPARSGWWTTEPDVGRVAYGVPFRGDRIKCLGNAVVPLQAKVAFKELMGLYE